MKATLRSVLPAPSAEDLRAALGNVDGLVQESCSRLMALARLVTLALETPQGAMDTELIASAMTMVRQCADELSNDVDCAAAAVGCSDRSAGVIDGNKAARVAAITRGAA